MRSGESKVVGKAQEISIGVLLSVDDACS
jgi:hypothetical protein